MIEITMLGAPPLSFSGDFFPFSHDGSPQGRFLFGSPSDTEPEAPRLELLGRAQRCSGRDSGCPVLAVKYWDQDLAYFLKEVEEMLLREPQVHGTSSVHLCDVQRYLEQFN